MPAATTRSAEAVRRLLVGLAVLCLVGGMLAGLVHRELLDADRFTDHADAVRTDPDVAAALGARITDQVLAADPDLVAVRPLVEAAATELVGSQAFSGAFRAAVAPLHRALVDGVQDDVVLTLADAAAVIVAVAAALSPRVAASLPADLDVRLSRIGDRGIEGRFVDAAGTTSVLAWLLPLLALLLLVGAAAADGRLRPRTLVRLGGTALLAAAAVTVVLLIVAGVLARSADHTTVGGAVLAAGWRELVVPAWTAVALVGAAGYLLRASTPLAVSLRPRALAAGARTWLTRPPATARQGLARAAVLLVVGVLLVADPLAVLRVAAVVAGVLLVGEGLLEAGAAAKRLLPALRGRLERPQRSPAWAAAALGVVLLAVAGAAGAAPVDRTVSATPLGTTPRVCNGHAELCDRRYDQVSFPATHNSMSAADAPGWFFAEQPTGVLGQLDDGIRTLLIDSWYGQPTNRPGIVASVGADRDKARAEAEREFGTAAVESALRLRASAGLQPRGRPAPYLCHGMCELGSTPWEPLMEQVRAWLDAHPQEVVTFIVQDEVSPVDTAALVEQAGLLPYVHLQREGEPWPTLGEMIASGRRVVFFMEHRGGGPDDPWLMKVNDWVQDTPFAFNRVSDFSCAPNRGRADAGMLLVNHWLSGTFSRVSDAARVNSVDVLGRRVEQCRRERGLQPTFVAVDFYDQGDLLAVVDRLNGFG